MLQTNNSQSWTTLILLAALLLAFFPGLFHFLWRAPLSLLSLFAGHLFIDGMVQPSAAPAPASAVTSWTQKTLTLPVRARGSYLITDDVVAALPELQGYRVGLLNLFVQHTSCGLALNENCDVDVRLDMDDALDRIAPEDRSRGLYRHAAEGPDDMPVRTFLVADQMS
jgi:secondary thiamine-phosphate synthase enzyme